VSRRQESFETRFEYFCLYDCVVPTTLIQKNAPTWVLCIYSEFYGREFDDPSETDNVSWDTSSTNMGRGRAVRGLRTLGSLQEGKVQFSLGEETK